MKPDGPSMIEYRIGDATAPEGAGKKIIVHVCNDVGGWGRGFVVAISKRWPEPEQRFRAWFRGGEGQAFALGEVQFVEVTPEITVANLIGQHGLSTRQKTPPIRYEAVRQGLRGVAERALRESATVHMPRIGCGLAGGRWEEMELVIVEELCGRGVEVIVYDLAGASR